MNHKRNTVQNLKHPKNDSHKRQQTARAFRPVTRAIDIGE